MQLLQITEPFVDQKDAIDHKVTAVGIDLGTTNSLVAFAINQQPIVITGNDGDLLLSIVAQDSMGEFIVGSYARDQLSHIKSVKRLTGKSSTDLLNNKHLYQQQLSYTNYTDETLNIQLNDKSYMVEQISAEILKKLKNTADQYFGYNITQAVITIPAYYDDAARNSTIFAAKLAGLDVLRLISEPTAAAYAYGLDQGKEGTFIVYDFGGGTFDVSILNMQMGVFQVITTNGDASLGGDDIDNAIFNYWLDKLQEHHDITTIDPAFGKLLYAAAISAKKKLSDDEISEHVLNYNNKIYQLQLTQLEFISIIQPIINRTFILLDQAIAAANLKDHEIAGLILVGGSTRLKYIKQQLNIKYNFTIFDNIDPDRVVAFGAALQAENLTYGSQNLIIDVTPLSIGLALMGNVVERIIERNTPIPCAVTKVFTTYADNQTAMKFQILQGERDIADQCRSLACFELTDIPAMKAGVARVLITFKIDADGILFINAVEETTGRHQGISLKPSYGLLFEQMQLMLIDAFENNEHDHNYRLLQQAIIEAEQLIRILKNYIDESVSLSNAERHELQKNIQLLTDIITTNNYQDIQTSIGKLQALAEQFINDKILKDLNSVSRNQLI